MGDIIRSNDLSLQNGHDSSVMSTRILVLGEVLWDIFEHSTRLGGAPLNFAAHARRLGHDVLLISGVGHDKLGDQTLNRISELSLNTKFVHQTHPFPTGTARVVLGPGDQTTFEIERPAAYDAVSLTQDEFTQLEAWKPNWLYFGTLFSDSLQGDTVLKQLLKALPSCSKFYDPNLRPGSGSIALVSRLLGLADAVKINEEEMESVRKFVGLPAGREAFCREGSRRFGWKAVCVTLGARGCAMLKGDDYVEAEGQHVNVADTVGAGDAFGAAFLHGLILRWPVSQIAAFANRVGALVASRHGAIPDWTPKEAVELGTP